MLRYTPLDIGFPLTCGHSDLLCFDWQDRTAEFMHPDNQDLSVCIRFEAEVIVRMLDEFPLSTETDPKGLTGLVPQHFAYRVIGDVFLDQQSDAWRFTRGPINHFVSRPAMVA